MPKSRYEQSRTNFANCQFLTRSWHRARGGINIKIVLFSLLGPRLAQGGREETPKRNKVSEICKSDVAKLTQGSKMTPKTITLARSASRSELLSLHCPRRLLLLALLPACAGSQVIMRQDFSAYAVEPLRTVGLLEAAHQYSLQDMRGSARTPIPTDLPIQE